MDQGAMRVVIVDDEPEIVLLERHLLDRDGRFEVVGEGSDGTSAVRLARTLQPHVIVLDVLMPVMDGWEALPLIKRVSPDTQVVVVSALGADSELNDRAVWLGAASYLDKLQLQSMPEVAAAACGATSTPR
jgi:DNA-binding NarL/FixJ family response regulator